MDTGPKITAVNRRRTAAATRSTKPDDRPGEAAGGTATTAGALPYEGTVVQRRFRRGRWTVTVLPV